MPDVSDGRQNKGGVDGNAARRWKKTSRTEVIFDFGPEAVAAYEFRSAFIFLVGWL